MAEDRPADEPATGPGSIADWNAPPQAPDVGASGGRPGCLILGSAGGLSFLAAIVVMFGPLQSSFLSVAVILAVVSLPLVMARLLAVGNRRGAWVLFGVWLGLLLELAVAVVLLVLLTLFLATALS